MKKKKILAAILCGVMVTASASIPAYADGTKVVTLGADLSEEQKQTMLNYFKVNVNEAQIITVTNQDERNHLANYIPLSQIGSHTFSCAYVNPTNSGGIKVRTANLNYVTGNMIATTLTTAGIRNCEVIAACPFKVSGTGALTGIQMAYETAVGEVLSSEKKDLAVKEIKVTEDLAATVGNSNATNVVNKAKMEIIENNVTEHTEIYNIVNNVVVENNVNIDQTQIDQVVNLMEGIAEQGYDYEDVKETLEHVDENLNEPEEPAEPEAVESSEDEEEEEDEVVYDEDSILNDIDEADLGLGDDVAVSSTEDQSLEEETYDPEVENGTQGAENEGWTEWPEEEGWETEVYTEGGDTPEAPPAENPEAPGTETAPTEGSGDEYGQEEFLPEGTETVVPETEGTETEVPEATGEGQEEMPAPELSEQAQSMYDQLETFCEGEFEGNPDSLAEAMGSDFVPSAHLYDTDLAVRLSNTVKDKYFTVLRDGAVDFTPDEGSTYMSDELNLMKQFLQKLFGIDGKSVDGEDILESLSQEDRQGFYNDTIRFFEKLYGEESFGEQSYDEGGNTEAGYDEGGSAEYSYDEGGYEEGGATETYEESSEGWETYNEETY